MNKKTIAPKKKLSGTLDVPGDKSISHRAVMFGAIAKGLTEIEGFLTGEDCLSTISCFQKLGVDIEMDGNTVRVHGQGLHGLTKPSEILDCGNSGTTLRLMTGLLAGQSFSCEITGDASIQKRPMGRVFEPLRQMGAKLQGKDGGTTAPVVIQGSSLQGIEYTLPVASAQVKSAILLAGLYANGTTVIHEPASCRNHTEIMLNFLGAEINTNDRTITCHPVSQLHGQKITIPGDISSAAFFIAAGLILPDSRLVITNVGVNETRTGIIHALKEMGGQIEIRNPRILCGEPVADLEVCSSKLQGITISGDLIPRMIDEIPVFAVAALFASGTTVIKDARELRVKESDRIQTMTEELGKMGAVIVPTEDGMVIEGGQALKGVDVESHGDHRVAMSLAVAGLAAESETCIHNSNCVDISFPGFYELLERL